MVGCTEVMVLVDAQPDGAILPVMADAALPMERLSEILQVPVHVRAAAAGAGANPGAYVIRLSLKDKPPGGASIHLGSSTGTAATRSDRGIWLWAETPEALRAAARSLTTRSGFPEI